MELPQEIKNHIVEQVEDADDLEACSIAHRSLTWAAQRELHRHVTYRWIIHVHWPVITDRDTYSNPDVAAFVKELSLTTLPLPERDELAWTVLSRLTNVTVLNLSICFDDMNWLWITPANRTAILQTFPNVETLRIDNSNFCHTDDLLFLLTAFPKLTTLALRDVLFALIDGGGVEEGMRMDHEDLRQEAIRSIPCSRLRRLEFTWTDPGLGTRPSDDRFEPLLEKWIVPLSKLVEPGFSLKWCEREQEVDPDVFSQIAETFGPVLSSLDLELTKWEEYDDCVDYGIQHCDKLESIALHYLCPSYHGDDPPSNGDGWALDVLSQITSTRLQSITLDFEAKDVDDFRAFDLPHLDFLLSQPLLADASVSLEFPREILDAKAKPGWDFHSTISKELSGLWARQGAFFVRLKDTSESEIPLIHKPSGRP